MPMNNEGAYEFPDDGAELDHCRNCTEALPYGEDVRIGDWLYCGACAHEEREASREEETRC